MYGYTAKASPDKNEVKYLRITDIQNDSVNWDEVPGCEIPDDKLKKYLLGKGDIVFARTGATTGKSFLVKSPPKSVFASYLIRVQVNNEFLLPEYVHYFFQTQYYWITINKGIAGAAQGGFNATKLKGLQIPIPPLPEQKAIVRLLDRAFAAIDQAQANLEKNIANAEELFQSKLNEIFSQRGEGWEERTLGDVCEIERGSSPRPIKKYITNNSDGVNWVKIGDVGDNDKYVKSTKQKITKEGALKSRFVDVGDFILSNSMSYGRAYIMAIPGYIHDGWFVLRLPNYVNHDYLWQLLSSPYLKRQFNDLAAGAIVKNISSSLVKKAIIPIPPIETQILIAKETATLYEKIDHLKKSYQRKMTELDNLKKSLLQKAFTGELSEKSAEQLLSNAKS
jgi:type I restriction enzyme S subunit